MMRVMTWNVWWRFGGRWGEREPRIAATLEAVRPDVVGLQEVWATDEDTQVDRFAAHLGMHGVFAGPSLPPAPVPPEAPDQAGVRLGVGLLSRWAIVEVTEHELPASHRGDAPVLLAVTLKHPDGPLHVLTAATEWEPRFGDDHSAQIKEIADRMADPARDGPLPVVLAADLNAAPDSALLRPLKEVTIDTWIAGGGDPDAVTLDSSHPEAPLAATAQLDRRIDHVLVRPGRPGVVQVPRVAAAFVAGDEPVDGLHPSDHYAVVVDLDV